MQIFEHFNAALDVLMLIFGSVFGDFILHTFF